MRRIYAAFLSLILMGAGCSQVRAPELASEEIDLHDGASMVIAQTWLGFTAPNSDTYGKRDVVVEDWNVDQSARLSWTLKTKKETEASQEARKNAANVPIGQEPAIPDPVYEDVVTSGILLTDALNNAERILLPSYWPEGEYDVRGEENSLLWLSRQQYDELVATQHSHIALGLFDSTLQDLIDFGEDAKDALAKLQGKIADAADTNADATELTAESNWSEYVLTVNGEAKTVKVVEASNVFARYVILANPENPLILKVTVKPFSLGFGMLSTLSVIKSLAGYEVTSINY